MTRLSKAFGSKFDEAVKEIRTRTFTLGKHEFKVRIPLNAEMEAISKRISDVDKDKVEERLKKMTVALRELPSENVEIKDDGDVVVEGRSTRETVTSILMLEARVVEYMKLLITEDGMLDDITYEEVDAELPFASQLDLMDAISEAIQPGYKDIRKNS
jgi:seryl-tRNA synthetase